MTSYLFNNKYKNLFVIITAVLNSIYCIYSFITNFPTASVLIESNIRVVSSFNIAFSFVLVLVGFILATTKIYEVAKILIATAFLLQITPILANVLVLEIPRFLIYSSLDKVETYISYIIPSSLISLLQIASLILLAIGFLKKQNNTVILRLGSIFLIILYLYVCIKELFSSIPDFLYYAKYLLFYISILLLTFNKKAKTETIEEN